jgi:predicted PurR-regulated permease PerM
MTQKPPDDPSSTAPSNPPYTPPDGGPPPDPREPPRSLRFLGWLKRFAKLWGFALFCLFVVYFFRHIVLPFVFAILVAYLLAPVVDRMARWRIGPKTLPRGAAVIMVYIVMLSVLGMSLTFIIPRLSGDFARLFREAPDLLKQVDTEVLPKVGSWIDRHFGAGEDEAIGTTGAIEEMPPAHEHTLIEPLGDGRYRLDLTGLALEVKPGSEPGSFVVAPKPPPSPENGGRGRWERAIKKWIEEKVKGTKDETGRALEYGRKFVTATVTGIWRLILVLMVAAFILVDLQRVRIFIQSLVPENYRGDFTRIARGIDRGLSGVIRGQLIICLVNGVLTYIGLLIFKVKYPLLLGGIAMVMSLVPIFGSFLSSVPIVVIAVVSRGEFDLNLGLYVTGWIILIHLVEANFLNPKIMGDAARTHPVLVVFALIAGEHTYGLVGALFAVPVLAIVQTVFVYLRRKSL